MKAPLSLSKQSSKWHWLLANCLFLFALLMSTGLQAQTTIISDGFENGLGNWTITTDNEYFTWSRTAGTGRSNFSTAYSGSYNAGVYYDSRLNTYTYLKLNTDLSMYSSLKLNFAYINPAWSSDIESIYVQYSTDGSNYSNVASYTSGTSSWATVSNLSIPSGTKYIRFAAYSNYGYGAGIDNVTVTGTLSGPAVRTMVCGTTYSGTLGTSGYWSSYTSCSYSEPGEEHVYAYIPEETGSYTFTTTTTSGDPDFFIMDSYGNTGTNVVGGCFGSGNKTVTLTGGHTYYFVADNYNSSSSAGYTVSVSCPNVQGIPYTETFEGSHDWQFANGSCTNKWYEGSAGAHDGSHGLFISNDGSSNAYTIGSTSIVYAYKKIRFATAGEYILSFDLKQQGESTWDCVGAMLYTSVPTATTSYGSSGLTSWPSGYSQVIVGAGKDLSAGNWVTITQNFTVSTAGVYYLVIAWKNDSSGGTQPPASVDNVSVAEAPTNVTINTSAGTGGSVSGGGVKTYGSSVTVTANPASCYSFVNWTENGTVVSTSASYTFNATSNRNLEANFALSSLTLSASASIITTGQSVTLSTNCAPTNLYTSEPSIWDGNSSSYTSSVNAPTHIGTPVVAGSTIRFTTAGGDPSIDMYNVGSFNPSIYKTFRMRYRITSGTGGNVEVFFVSTSGSNTGGATTGYSRTTNLTSDGNWHIAEIDMSQHASWVANGNVKGWRLDPCNASGVTMEIDWVGLFPDPIAQNVTSYTHTPTATGNITYTACSYAAGMLKAPTAQTTVTVNAPPATIPYTCNFENTSENGNWLTANAIDGWFIGNATYNSSSRSLYVSADNGSANSYSSANQYIYAYRSINFATAGYYIVSYLWKANGESTHDYLRAFLVPESAVSSLVAGTSNGISTSVAPSGWIAVDGSTKLNLQTSWQTYTGPASIPTAGTYYLVFYWVSDGSVYNTPPAAVDDISITQAPTHVTINASASPSAGGSVSGGGTTTYGSSATVTANPASGYAFENWTEGGTVVSVNASYTFTATTNRTLVANFRQSCPIVEVGSGTGTTNGYYIPMHYNWKYSLTEQIYTPCEIGHSGDIGSLAFYNYGSTQTYTFDIYLKTTNKEAFSSSSDWETVSSSNLVFSGTVTFTGSAWTTVYLDQSFSYNGTNNLMVVINNHTGSYTSGSNFYTYSANGYQAIYAYNDSNGPYTPTSTLSGSTSYTTYKNRINFGICDQAPLANVTISASAGTGGSVSGSGAYTPCATVTLTATPASCYQFVSWTENGTVVSTNATYSFTATDNRTLVANFEETPWQPAITSNPSATTCIAPGTPVTLTANITGASSATSLADYTFSTGTDASKWRTLTSATDIISVTSATDSKASEVEEIGFTFTFAGVDYTQFSANSDGNLKLGSSATGTGSYSSPFSSSNAGTNAPKINFFGCDGKIPPAPNGYVKKQVLGTAPNRVCVVEFSTSTFSSYADDKIYNWQVQLFEGTNQILVVFPSTVPSTLPSVQHQYGISTSTSDLWLVDANHTANYYTSGQDATIAASTWPGANRYYSFTPPTPPTYAWSHTGTPGSASGGTYSVTPTQSSNNYTVSATYEGCTRHTNQRVTVQDATPTGLTFTNVTYHSATASWNAGNASYWEYSYDGGNTWTSTTSNTVDLTDLTISTVYLFQVRTANSACPSGTASGQFTTECTPRTFAWNGGSGNINLQPFETTQSAASVSVGGGTITYSSEDPTVATIDENGNVTALHPGTTILYADVTIDDPYCSGSLVRTVTVTACPDITLGSGTSTTNGLYIPSYYSNSYSLSEQLYSPCEIGKAGTISSLSFYNNSTTSTTRKFDIYLVHTDKAAFSSTTDWIHPTAADKVYSGTANTVFEPSGWTTIYFDQPFEYNGTQFLAVIIDNNLGTTSTSAYFRTYTADGNQAIRINGTADYDPASITYTGTTYSVKNQVKFGMCNQREASATFNIAATANPTGGGTIEGTGSYELCQTVTLTANPDPCYRFVRWRENGTNLSTNRTLTFKATKDRTLEAEFEEWGVNIAANGQTSDITVERGTEVTLTAAFSPAPPVTPTYTWVATAGTEGTVSGNNGQIYTVTPMEITNIYTLTADVNGCQKNATRTVTTTCPVPTNLQVTYTANGAEITWDGDADEYNVQYGIPAHTYTPTLLSEDFENYAAFDVNPEGSWTFYDGDGAYTYSIEDHLFPNNNYIGAGIILNTNALSDLGVNYPAHSGNQYFTMFNAIPDYIEEGTATNDWLISPEIPTTYNGRVLSFYARELTDLYGAETMRVLYSTTTNNPDAFQLLGTESVSSTEWTHYTYNLPDNAKYFAINCTSDDIFALFIDDISVTAAAIEVPASVFNSEHVTGNTYTLSCLEPGVSYQVQVQAYCGIDDLSAWSQSVNVNGGGAGSEPECTEVGTGTATTSYGPIYTWISTYYSYTQQLYLASEIGNSAGQITSISFKYYGFYSSTWRNLTETSTIYMGQTSNNTLSSWLPVPQQVFQGTVTYNYTDATGNWITINLDSPFEWDGTSNIVIAFNNTTIPSLSAGSNDCYFYGTSVSNMALYYRNSSAITLNDDNNTTGTGTAESTRPNIRFCIAPPPNQHISRRCHCCT